MIRSSVFIDRPLVCSLILMLAILPVIYFVRLEIKQKVSKQQFSNSIPVEIEIQSFMNDWIETSFDYSLTNTSKKKSICFGFLSPAASQFFKENFCLQKSPRVYIVAGPLWSSARRINQNLVEFRYPIRYFSVDIDFEMASADLVFVLEQKAKEFRIQSIKFANQQDKIAISDFFKKIDFEKHSNYSATSKTFFRKAASLFFEDKLDAAVIEIEKCLKLEPNYVNALYLRIICNQNLSDLDQVENDLNHLIMLNPSQKFLYAIRSSVRIHQSNYSGALEDLLMAKERIQERDFRLNQAYCLSKLDKYKEALVELDSAIKIAPLCSDAYYERAYIKEEHGDHFGAKIDFSIEKHLSGQTSFFDSSSNYCSWATPIKDFVP